MGEELKVGWAGLRADRVRGWRRSQHGKLVNVFTNSENPRRIRNMSIIESSQKRPRILVVGGGYVGLYVAMKLQKKVKDHGGIVTVVDPNPYMTYQPFLPEVAGGQIEPRHVVVSHRAHLKHSNWLTVGC